MHSYAIYLCSVVGKPVVQAKPEWQAILGDVYFKYATEDEIQHIQEGMRRGQFPKKSQSMISNGEIIGGIVRWDQSDEYGHRIVVKMKGEYYVNIQPIWPDSVKHKQPAYNVGDKVKLYNSESGTLLEYVGTGWYRLSNGKTAHINGIKCLSNTTQQNSRI